MRSHCFLAIDVQMLALLSLWMGVSLPLVMGGFFFGFRKGAFEVALAINQIPRQVAFRLHSHCVLT